MALPPPPPPRPHPHPLPPQALSGQGSLAEEEECVHQALWYSWPTGRPPWLEETRTEDGLSGSAKVGSRRQRRVDVLTADRFHGMAPGDGLVRSRNSPSSGFKSVAASGTKENKKVKKR